MATKTPTVSRREDMREPAPKRRPVAVKTADDLSELEALRRRVAELEGQTDKTRKKKGPFDDLAEAAFKGEPHWDPRITRYYAQGSPDLKELLRDENFTRVNDVTDYVISGVHLRHVGALDVLTSAGKGAKVDRTSNRVVEVLK